MSNKHRDHHTVYILSYINEARSLHSTPQYNIRYQTCQDIGQKDAVENNNNAVNWSFKPIEYPIHALERLFGSEESAVMSTKIWAGIRSTSENTGENI